MKIMFIKTVLITIIFLLCSRYVYAAEISVRIDNPPESGSVALALFNSANTFGDLRDPYKMVIHDIDGRDEYTLMMSSLVSMRCLSTLT